ncbi:pyrroloquinoline quinone biosynthesis protein PqqB [Polaribacter irgensii 23-P]|uniref:Pyrroloquinoline quinone biosynthesis protein PqqB n=1 Tax=Polaribacter irgensii 23-P TaxID=313594 RepID=A4BW04_9FLAO|nr:MBL fold metallo-hydrolase [Polaribacter irgensii]EAR13145.1 pyrroloquinoline quinone biosynthesis protein PqqB [Polaribacter irgensii 23-P]
MTKQLLLVFCFSLLCRNTAIELNKKTSLSKQYITVLGIAQDAGYPHIGCQKSCCTNFYEGKYKKQKVVSLGLVDTENKQKWLFEATPDIATQLADLEQNHLKTNELIDGIFLTHAHIGHYTGLMYFGKEALGQKETKVFAMPKMRTYLTKNGPWSQLVKLRNIVFNKLQADSTLVLNNKLKVTPFLVPHRDEFSETIGYKIEGMHKTALFIPDIDKWEKWKKNIVIEVKKVDYAFLDATFFQDGEVDRPMAKIPHPFIEETMRLFKKEAISIKNKIYFIHFNHTNPALQKLSNEKAIAQKLGFNFAIEGMRLDL